MHTHVMRLAGWLTRSLQEIELLAMACCRLLQLRLHINIGLLILHCLSLIHLLSQRLR